MSTAPAHEAPRRSWVRQIMGMPISVLARGEESGSACGAAAVQAVFDELAGVDRTFSLYREDSAVTRINAGDLRRSEAGDDVLEVARLCDEARDLTDGRFDARRPDGRWDPSGLVKGWAVERAARLLPAGGLDWCLNAGGDVLVSSASGRGFNVGIQDPLDGAGVAAVVTVLRGAVATSGTAARGRHLYDPHTGGFPAAIASVTVTGPSLARADVLATAAFVAGAQALEFVQGFEGYAAMVLDARGRRSVSDGWR